MKGLELNAESEIEINGYSDRTFYARVRECTVVDVLFSVSAVCSFAARL